MFASHIKKRVGLVYIPSNKLRTHFKAPSKIAEDVTNLRIKKKYKKGTEIVLILSFASDAMNRVVLMFPEVIYMDVTSSTNQQNRPIFLMVVKDANRQTYIAISVFYLLKKWVFNEILGQSTFHFMEKTLSIKID